VHYNDEQKNFDRWSNKIGTSYFSCLYFFGYGYLSSYYGNLSISLKLIDFQLSDYLLAGLIPVLFALFFIIVSFYSWKQKPEKHIVIIFSNVIFTIQLLIICLYSVLVFGNTSLLITDNFIIVVVVILIILINILINTYIMDKSIPYELYNKNIYWEGILILILIIFVFSVACISGNIVAEQTIQGNNSHSKDVKLILKDKNVSDEIENKSLILIVIDENKFYFIEKNETLRKYPKLYIIPSNQIKIVILKQNNA